MSDDPGELADEAADAFAAVGNEFRLRILHLLDTESRMPFSDVQEALDEDDPGRLNYHLNQLVDTFVDRSEDGYRLTLRGARLVNAVLAGRFVDEYARHDVPVEGECYVCSASELTLRQFGKGSAVVCEECEETVVSLAFPIAAWQNRPKEDVPAVFDQWVSQNVDAARLGACPECTAGVETVVEEDALGFAYTPRFDCTVCTRSIRVPYGLLAWHHPEVRRFHREHGVDVESRGFWAVPQAVDRTYTDFPETDPVRAVVRFPVEDGECRVYFDAETSVERVERERFYD
jgi:DNA-binding transcriptional ArsR family regulator